MKQVLYEHVAPSGAVTVSTECTRVMTHHLEWVKEDYCLVTGYGGMLGNSSKLKEKKQIVIY